MFLHLFKLLCHLDIFTLALKMMLATSKRRTSIILILLLKGFSKPLVINNGYPLKFIERHERITRKGRDPE